MPEREMKVEWLGGRFCWLSGGFNWNHSKKNLRSELQLKGLILAQNER